MDPESKKERDETVGATTNVRYQFVTDSRCNPRYTQDQEQITLSPLSEKVRI